MEVTVNPSSVISYFSMEVGLEPNMHTYEGKAYDLFEGPKHDGRFMSKVVE